MTLTEVLTSYVLSYGGKRKQMRPVHSGSDNVGVFSYEHCSNRGIKGETAMKAVTLGFISQE